MPFLPTVVVDCRWLGIGGPGRTTELLLRGLADDPPPGQWVLWGPAEPTGMLAWPGASVVPVADDPRGLLGQRHALAVPRGDLVVFMHQQRPLRAVPSVTLIYDTIALRHGTNTTVRAVKRVFLRRVAGSSRGILTISEHSRASVVQDLGVDPAKVAVLRFPFDDAFVERVSTLRGDGPLEEVALYAGGFLPHKNLPRLVAAFEATTFCREGGRLVLVGGTARQAAAFTAEMTDAQRRWLTIRQSCSQPELDQLFASSLLLVQPSLEEGFGLPAWEALCCGMTVCASDGGALPEVVKGFADPFLATSVAEMTSAIDESARQARSRTPEDRSRQIDLVRGNAPSVRQFGMQVRTLIEAQVTR